MPLNGHPCWRLTSACTYKHRELRAPFRCYPILLLTHYRREKWDQCLSHHSGVDFRHVLCAQKPSCISRRQGLLGLALARPLNPRAPGHGKSLFLNACNRLCQVLCKPRASDFMNSSATTTSLGALLSVANVIAAITTSIHSSTVLGSDTPAAGGGMIRLCCE